MAVYMPILKGRTAEFTAISNTSFEVQGAIRPLLEVIPNAHNGLYGSILDFCDRAMRHAPKGMIFAVDCGLLTDNSDTAGTLPMLSYAVHDRRIPMVPVFASCEPDTLAAVRAAAELHGTGACLRIRRAEIRPQQIPGNIEDVLTMAGLPPQQVDLLIDFGEIATKEAEQRAIGPGQRALAWAKRTPWRSVTFAAGAFPLNISDLPLNTSTPIPRWDAILWSKLAGRPIGSGDVDYGDYAISNPKLPLIARPGVPNLRYTGKRHWHVYRYRRSSSGGWETFHDLCRAVVSSDHWPPQGSPFSWGDEQIEQRAKQVGRPGRPMDWRAFGMSHHLAVVTDRLRNLGEP
jgi:hypothetical protein